MYENKQWCWRDYITDLDVNELEQKIQLYGIDSPDSFNFRIIESCFGLSFQSKEKIDIIFKYKPSFVTYVYNKHGRIDYIKLNSDYTNFVYTNYPPDLYLFYKLMENLDLKVINSYKILFTEITTRFQSYVNKCKDNKLLGNRIYATSIVDFFNLHFLRHKNHIYFYINYQIIFKNEVVRKTTLSRIVFKKINQF